MRAIQEKSISVEIEYVDYIIARSISDLIREWVGTLEKVNSSKIISKIQGVSHYLRAFITLLFFTIPTVFFYLYADKTMLPNVSENFQVVQYLLMSAFSIVCFKEIGVFLGRNLERSIDSINANDVSFININAGDKNQLIELTKGTKRQIYNAIYKGII